MKTRNDYMAKIEKLLRKTVDNGATEAEAQQALLMAQKLMAEHHIALREIKDSDNVAAQVIRGYTGRKALAQWSIQLLGLIARNFRCRSFLNNNCATFIGEEGDVELATELYKMVYDIAQKGTRKIRKQYRKDGRSTAGVADSYLIGFIDGLRTALEEQKEAESQSFALILITPQSVIEAYQDIVNSPITKSVKGRQLGYGFDSEAREKGKADGYGSIKRG